MCRTVCLFSLFVLLLFCSVLLPSCSSLRYWVALLLSLLWVAFLVDSLSRSLILTPSLINHELIQVGL